VITSGQTTVGTAVAVQIDGSSANPSYLTVHNNDNTKALFLGGADVTISNGLRVLKEQTLTFSLNPGEALYAVSDSGSHVVSWLRQAL
jgi:hypothetical protein